MQFSSISFSASVIALGLVTGCARPQPANMARGPQADGRYECLRAPQAQESGTPARRSVTVRFDVATRSTVLTLPGERRQILSMMPAETADGGLYANDLYAWRADTASAVLTDVGRVATYECRRTGDGPAAHPAAKAA